MKIIFRIFISILLFTAGVDGGVVRVPQDQSSIQAGIEAAANGDTVLVADSTYYENIDFKGKAITVASYYYVDGDTNHINNTIINGSQPSLAGKGSVVFFISGEDTTSILCGFTITGGTGTYYDTALKLGGGIYCKDSGAKISHNKILLNSVTHGEQSMGGGIGLVTGHYVPCVVIEDNVIESNSLKAIGVYGGGIAATCDTTFGRTFIKIIGNKIVDNYASATVTDGSAGGGGVDVQFCNVRLKDNVIGSNIIHGDYGYGAGVALFSTKEISIVEKNTIADNRGFLSHCLGGGLYAGSATGLTIRDNVFKGNFGRAGGGIAISYCSPHVYNNIIVQNKAGVGGGFWFYGSSTAQIMNNTMISNQAAYGGAICTVESNPCLLNNIIWGNQDSANNAIYLDSSTIAVAYCDVQGGYPGTGNIEFDPQLMDTVGISGDSLFACLASGSPCIDAGDPDPAFNDPEAPNNHGYALWPSMGTVRNDMGAYGGPGAEGWMMTGIDDRLHWTEEIPDGFQLRQNYPNPFNPSTTIEFALPKSAFVTLKVYNVLGEEVVTLIAEKRSGGIHKFNWDASGLASGEYLYRLETGDFVQMKKLILLR